MIKKIRTEFILASMMSLLIVLAAIISAVNILNYRTIVNEADNTLSLLDSNDGKFPIREESDSPPEKSDVPPEIPNENQQNMPSEKNPPDSKKNRLSPELPYESRFFSVVITESKEIVSVDTQHIAAIDELTASELALKAINSGCKKGFEDNYRYIIGSHEDNMQVIFLDCTRNLSTFNNFFLLSCGISIAGYAAVFVLVVLLSGRIMKPVAESYEKQKRFITDAGHEIKTPITIIGADAEVLECEIPDNEWLQDIKLQISRLTALTNDLIFLSRMDEAQELQTIEFPFSDVVNETALSFQTLAKSQHKELTIDVEPMLTVNGEEKSLRQLVSILLDNAVKYSPENSTIVLSLHRTGKNIMLSVTNPSEEISKKQLERLFERFYRTDKSRSSVTGGHGIGLSIAKAIVNAHKGKISAAIANGNSLTITAVIPECGI